MTKKFDFDYIILLTGQSNALGIGGNYDPYSEEDQPDPRIWGYVSGRDYWTIFDLNLQIGSKKPTHQCMAFHYAKGLLKTNPMWNIGIIICGLSGQSICRWVKPYKCKCPYGHYQPSSLLHYGKVDSGDIYDWSVLMVNAALLHCNNENYVNTIMWHQGESDCMETCMWYYERLQKVIKQYRNESWFTSDSRFMCGQLYENGITDKMNYVFALEYGWVYFKLKQLTVDFLHYKCHTLAIT